MKCPCGKTHGPDAGEKKTKRLAPWWDVIRENMVRVREPMRLPLPPGPQIHYDPALMSSFPLDDHRVRMRLNGWGGGTPEQERG